MTGEITEDTIRRVQASAGRWKLPPVDREVEAAANRDAWAGFMRAFGDPLRLALLDAAASHPERQWTARQLADHVGVKAARVYHHLKLLVGQGLLHATGGAEKHYRAGEFLRPGGIGGYADLQYAIGRRAWRDVA